MTSNRMPLVGCIVFACSLVFRSLIGVADEPAEELGFSHALTAHDGTCSVVFKVTNRSAKKVAVLDDAFLYHQRGKIPLIEKFIIYPTDEHAFQKSFACSTDMEYLEARFHWQGIAQARTRVVLLSVPDPLTREWSGLMAPLVGLSGVALGALLTQWLTTNRERERARQEWCKANFLNDQPHLRQFVRDWGGQTNATLLADTFSRLEECCWIPAVIRSSYQKTISKLREGSYTEPDREKACRELIRIVENYRKEPWAKHLN